jgi:hypothetical protein
VAIPGSSQPRSRLRISARATREERKKYGAARRVKRNSVFKAEC